MAMDSYVLDPSDAETGRLVRAADLLATIAASAFHQAGLAPGKKVIDVGCGPIGALGMLREVVGDSGTVVGLDISSEALSAARTALEQRGITDVRLVAADINEVDSAQVGGNDFDLAYCRLVLMHQRDPAATLSRIASLLHQGAHLVAFDFFAPPRVEPALPEVERAWELIIGAMRARGASPDVSRRYGEHCDMAGLDIVSERGTFIPMPVSAVTQETTVLLTGARRGVEAAGLATETEIDRVLAQVSSHADRPGRAWSPETVELIARKR